MLTFLLAAGYTLTTTKRDYTYTENTEGEGNPQAMTIVDETMEYKIYKHDATGVWYFCCDNGKGKSVVVMVKPDGTPYTGGKE